MDKPPHRNGKQGKPKTIVRPVPVVEEVFSVNRCDYCAANTVNGACPNEGEDYPHPPTRPKRG